MRRDDYTYFRRRIVEEEAATRNTASPQARERHRELAAAYRLRCSLIEELISKGVGKRIAITSDQEKLRAKPESSLDSHQQGHCALDH